MLDGLAEPLRRHVRHSLMQDDYVYNRDRLHGVLVEVAFSLGALSLLVLLLLLANARQLGRIGRLYNQAKTAEHAATEAGARLKEALLAISEGFILLDRDNRIVLVNERFRSFYPSIADRLVPGADFLSLVQASVVDWALEPDVTREAAIADRLARLRDAAGPWEQRLADGRVLLVGERRTAGGGTVSIRTEITERVVGERQRMELQQQLNHAQRLEAIGRLAGGVAHDFNNILASMLGYARFIAEDLPPEHPAAEFAEQILTAGQRAKELVQQILVYSRSGEQALEPTDVAAAVDETAHMLRATLPATIRVRADCAAGPSCVMGSATRLTQVLMNLGVNAADAIGAGHGEIAIGVDVVAIDGGCSEGLGRVPARIANTTPMRIEAMPAGATRMWLGRLDGSGKYVRITLRDTGTGIERAVLERMFEPFFTTKGRNQGTGLGLAAVLGIVSSHHGAITIDTRVGHGTTFNIYLPLIATTVVPAKPVPVRARNGAGRVLVVDDQPDVAAATATALRRAGYMVEIAGDGAAALDLLSRPGESRFDLVVSDQIMPQLSGVQLLRALRESGNRVPVVLCTGYADAVDESDARRLGAAALLYKPVDLDTLLAAAHAAMPTSSAAA
jgi:signal transduction histidine kinase/CheY-like chemotaxis protein